MSKATPAPLGAALIRKGESVPPSAPAIPAPSEPVAPPSPLPATAPSLPPRVGTIAVTLRLDPNRYEALKGYATAHRRTNQDILRDALDAYLRQQARA